MNWQEGASPSDRALNAEQEQEARLAAQARAGAEWALTALIARYQPSVTRYLTRLTGNPDQARGLAERIFVRMERRLHGPHGAEQLRLWLLRACTEAGLDALRRPKRKKAPPRLQAPSPPRALLTERAGAEPVRRLLSGWGRLKQATSSTSRQVRQLIWTIRSEATGQQAWRDYDEGTASGPRNNSPLADTSEFNEPLEDDLDTLDPREALRHRLVRVVLAELPYGDAQCLALHLVAGLNQAEVARALGLTASATRRRIVHGLQAFSTRYAAAIANLGIPAELGYQNQPTSAAVEPDRTSSPNRGALFPPAAASVPVVAAIPAAPYESVGAAEAVEDYASPPMADIEQEPTMRLWPPSPPSAPAPYASEPAEPTEPSQPDGEYHKYDEYAANAEDTEDATTAIPVVAGTPTTEISDFGEEPGQWGESDEWGAWAQHDIGSAPTQPTDSQPSEAAYPDAYEEWDAPWREAPQPPDTLTLDTDADASGVETPETPETEEQELAPEQPTPILEQSEEETLPPDAQRQDEMETPEQPDALIPDEVDEGSITQPSLQRIARQAAIEEARRQLAANAGNVERNGVVTSLAQDAVVWPVVDALPVVPAASSARLTYSPDSAASSQGAAGRTGTTGPLSYEVSSVGAVEVAVEQEGSAQHEEEMTLGYEAPVEQDQQ